MKAKGFYDKVFGIECPHCGERGGMKWMYSTLTRAYNELCTQAAGDAGFICSKCIGITWTHSFEDFKAICPDWVKPYADRAKARYFPDFKYNGKARKPYKVAALLEVPTDSSLNKGE